MEELDYNHEIFNAQQAEQDKNLAVRFYVQALKDDEKSAAEGRPIFSDTVMIEIRVRGDRNNIVIRPIREDDKARFRQAFTAYERNLKTDADGTPLSEWPVLGLSMVEELKFLGFNTVEQLATATDSVVAKIPGLQTFKQKAIVFLEFSKGAAPLEKLQVDLEAEKQAREAAQNQAADMSARLAEMERKYAALADKIVASPAPAKVAAK